MEGMKNWKGTIANALNQHINELAPLMDSPKQLPALKAKVNYIIQHAELNRENDREEAINILTGIKSYTHYLSTLATYLTGMKVS